MRAELEVFEEAAAPLRRASAELRSAHAMVEDLEEVIGAAIALAGQARAEQMLELQKLDHICQKILGVADFLQALSNDLPGDWRVNASSAARGVLLAELGARLGGSPAAFVEQARAETYDLF